MSVHRWHRDTNAAFRRRVPPDSYDDKYFLIFFQLFPLPRTWTNLREWKKRNVARNDKKEKKLLLLFIFPWILWIFSRLSCNVSISFVNSSSLVKLLFKSSNEHERYQIKLKKKYTSNEIYRNAFVSRSIDSTY